MLSRFRLASSIRPCLAGCALLVLLACPCAASAQSVIVLGTASAQLTGPWKFHAGDNPAWAQPGIDDSHWSTMDLTPPQGSRDPYMGSSGFVPGWTARGYPGYAGFAWYRLRVKVRNSGGERLALKMPHNVDDAYQVYANGQFIGEFGSFSGKQVRNYISQPRTFMLPAGMGDGTLTLAVRMWMDPHTLLVENTAGGMHGPPVLGQAPVILAMDRLDWDAVDRTTYGGFIEIALLLLAIATGFSLFALDRDESAYLWLAVNSIVILLNIAAGEVVLYTTWVPAMPAVFFRDVLLLPAQMGFWIVFWASWFRLEDRARLFKAAWALVVLQAFGTALQRAPLYGRLIPVDDLAWAPSAVLVLKLLLGAMLVWIAYRGLRKHRTEALLALPAVALTALAQYQYELELFHAPIVFFVHGYLITANQIATGLSLAIITVLLLRRFVQAQRMREQWRLEIEQAREIQQVLIPEEHPAVPGFMLEAEYRPSLQVGGDFYQIIPAEDGSLLAVIGDVSGKGLRAAMLVALIVGAIRTLAAFTRDPMEILSGVNDRLCGHVKSQFATCLVLHIAASGHTTMANAGHLPPYWNGSEVAMPGSLPLGLVQGAAFEPACIDLQRGGCLMLISDGIVEAQNGRGELFGFSRVQEMSSLRLGSAEIAAAAQAFGQEDDITVLRIERI